MSEAVNNQTELEIARLRAELAAKEAKSPVGGSSPEEDDLILRMGLTYDADIAILVAQIKDSVRDEGWGELDERLQNMFWQISEEVLPSSTIESAFSDADEYQTVVLRVLQSLASGVSASTGIAVHVLAELRMQRKDAAAHAATSLALQQRQIELLEQLVQSAA